MVSLHMQPAPITCNVIDAPIPETIRRVKPVPPERETMFTLLGTMEVGGMAIEVNRSRRSVQQYIRRFRQVVAPESQFVTREAKPGWAHIWRVA